MLSATGHSALVKPVTLAGAGVCVVKGTAGADTIRITDNGSGFSIVLNGKTYNRTNDAINSFRIQSGAGNDVIRFSGSTALIYTKLHNVIEAGEGDDIIVGSSGVDAVYGNGGNDNILGGGGRDSIRAGSGADTVNGDSGNDNIEGGLGHDVLRGGKGDDSISGGSGNDRIWGNDGNDLLTADHGNDSLSGEAGRDTLRGGSGNNVLWGGDDYDSFDSGGGHDKIDGDKLPKLKYPSGGAISWFYGDPNYVPTDADYSGIDLALGLGKG
jgi:Ca2+-binding RTX toxin-like protein